MIRNNDQRSTGSANFFDYYKDFYIIFLRFPSYDGRDTIVLRLKSFIRKTSIPRFIDK